jgi:hypothetical protein
MGLSLKELIDEIVEENRENDTTNYSMISTATEATSDDEQSRRARLEQGSMSAYASGVIDKPFGSDMYQAMEETAKTPEMLGEYLGTWFGSKSAEDALKQDADEINRGRIANRGLAPTGDTQDAGILTYAMDIPTSALTGGIGSAVAKGVFKVATKEAIKDVKKNALDKAKDILIGNTTKDKVYDAVGNLGDDLANAAFFTPREMMNAQVDASGNYQSNIDTSFSGFLTNMGLEAIVDMAFAKAGRFGLEAPGKIARSVALRKAYGDVTNAKLNIDKDFILVINSNYLKDLDVSDVDNGFIKTDSIDNLKDLDASSYAFIDKDGYFEIKTPKLGTIRGKKIGSDYVATDVGSIKNYAKELKYRDRALIEPQNYGSKAKTNTGNSKAYHGFKTVKMDSNGSIVDSSGKTLDSTKINRFNKVFQGIINSAKKIGIKPNSKFEKQNIVGQLISSKVSNPKDIKFEELSQVKDAMNKLDLKAPDFKEEVLNNESKGNVDAEVVERLYKGSENTYEGSQGVVYDKVEPDVEEAIKYGILNYVANVNEDVNLETANPVNSITSKVMKILGVDGDSYKAEISKIVQKYLDANEDFKMLTDDGKLQIINEKYNTPGLEAFEAIDKQLSKTDRKKYYTANEASKLEPTDLVQNDYGFDGDILNQAIKESQLEFTINEDAFNSLKKIKLWNKKGVEPTAEAIRIVQKDSFGGATDKEILTRFEENLTEAEQKEIITKIENLDAEIQYVTAMKGEVGSQSIRFEVKLDSDGRVYYTSEVNPKHPLGRFLFNLKSQKVDISTFTNEDIETEMRSFLMFFGYKPEHMSRIEIQKTFQSLLNKNDTELKRMATEEVKAFGSYFVDRLKEFKNVLDNGGEFVSISEIDGINNGIAIFETILGMKDKSLGLGDLPDANTPDKYEIFANELNKLGFNFGRSDVKTMSIGVFNNASDYEATKALSQSLRNSIIGSKLSGKDIDAQLEQLRAITDKMIEDITFNIVDKNGALSLKDFHKIKESIKKEDNLLFGDNDNDLLTFKKQQLQKLKDGSQSDIEALNLFIDKVVKKRKKFADANVTKEQIRREIVENNINELSDMIDTIYIVSHLENGSHLTDALKEKFDNAFAKEYQHKVKSAIRNALGEDLMLLRDTLKKTIDKKFELFAKHFVLKNLSFDSAKNIIDDLYEGIDVEPTKLYRAKKMLESKGIKDKVSLKDILEAIHEAKIDKKPNIMASKAFKEAIPTLSHKFGSIPVITLKGYAGYSSATKLNFESVTPRFIFQPNYVMNLDSNIMANSFTDMVSLWDAGIGSAKEINQFAKRANEQMNVLLGGLTIAEELNIELKNTLNELEGFNPDSHLTDAQIRDLSHSYLAEQTLMSKDKKITQEAIKKEKNKIAKRGEYSHIEKLEQDLIKLHNKVYNNRKKWGKGDKIAQYTNGAVYTEYSPTNVQTEFKQKGYYEKATFDKSYLSDVEPLKSNEYVVELKIGYRNYTNKEFSNPIIEFGSDRSDTLDNVIRLRFDDLSNPDNFRELSHEIVHYADYLRKLGNPKFGSSLEMVIEDLFTNGNLYDYYGNKIEFKGNSDELKTEIIGRLLANELYANNPKLFAKLFKTNDIAKVIKDNAISVKINDNTIKVESLSELYNIINDLSDQSTRELALSEIDYIVKEAYLSLGKNDYVLAKINGLDLKDNYKSTFDADKKVTKVFDSLSDTLNNSANELVNSISNMSLFEIFEIGRTKESILYAVNLKDGFVKQVNDAVSKFQDEFDKTLEHYGLDESDDHIAGLFMVLGGHQFMKMFKESNSMSDFVSKINKDVEANRRQLMKKLINSLPDPKDYIEFEKLISNIALYGSSRTMHKLHKRANRLAKDLVALNPDYKHTEVKRLLMLYANKRATYYKINGSFKSFDVETGIIDINRDAGIVKRNEKLLRRVFTRKHNNSNFTQFLEDVKAYHSRFENEHTLFGINPEINLENKKLVAVPKDKKYKGKAVGSISYKDKQYDIYIRERVNHTIGRQDSEIIELEPPMRDWGVYSIKVDGKELNIEPQALNYSKNFNENGFLDTRASVMIRRNMYSNIRAKQGKQILFEQNNILKKSDVLLTKQDIDDRGLDKKDYVKLDRKNALTTLNGTVYVHKKYIHYFEGTKGVNYKKAIQKVFGKDNSLGNIIIDVMKLTIELTKVLRGTVLVTHLSSYVNSFVGSTIILQTHTNGKGVVYLKQASKEFDSFKKQFNETIKVMIDKGENSSEYKQALSQLKKHKLYNAFKFGIASTIRSSLYNLGSLEASYISNRASIIFGSKQAGEVAKNLTLDPTTKAGKVLGEWFDKTEMNPKIALYLYELEQTGSQELATKKVLMAFPTYNNINGVLAAFDEFSPYTKYLLNIPKMINYAHSQAVIPTAIFGYGLSFIPYMTWDEDDEKKYEWYMEHGFAKVDEDSAYYAHNLFPYNLPVDFDKKSVLDYIFAYDVVSDLDFLPDAILTTDLDSKSH